MAAPVANAGSDVVLAFGALPTTQALTGAASGGSGTYVSWQWYLLQTPSGSLAALSSTTVQNPTLNGIDTPGDYRLMLAVTDDAAETSEVDPRDAPNSAFVTVRVTTQYAALYKSAPGRRDWHTDAHAETDEVDTLRGDLDAHEADTADPHNTLGGVTAVTGTPAADKLLVASGAAAAVWSTPPTAGAATLGRILTAETAADPANPKAVTQDRDTLTAFVGGTLAAKTGLTPSEGQCAFVLHEDRTVTDFAASLLDGGGASQTNTVKLYQMTSAQYLANDWAGATELASVDLVQGLTATAPTHATDAMGGGDVDVSAGELLVVRCTAASGTAGADLSVTIGTRLKW